jgi:hypothetical protein
MGKRRGLTNPRRLCYEQETRINEPTSGKICEITHRLHQKRHRLASPCRLVLLHACKWVGKSNKKLYCTEIITQACLLRCKITHTHILQSSLIHHKVTMWPYLHDEICKITHTDRSCSLVDLARKSSILRAFGLFFMTRYAPDSGFFFMLTSEHKSKIQRGWKHIP